MQCVCFRRFIKSTDTLQQGELSKENHIVYHKTNERQQLTAFFWLRRRATNQSSDLLDCSVFHAPLQPFAMLELCLHLLVVIVESIRVSVKHID